MGFMMLYCNPGTHIFKFYGKFCGSIKWVPVISHGVYFFNIKKFPVVVKCGTVKFKRFYIIQISHVLAYDCVVFYKKAEGIFFMSACCKYSLFSNILIKLYRIRGVTPCSSYNHLSAVKDFYDRIIISGIYITVMD